MSDPAHNNFRASPLAILIIGQKLVKISDIVHREFPEVLPQTTHVIALRSVDFTVVSCLHT